ncbi:MerR family transcriptional regulator [Salinispora cortesiana]|uniref:MerR family transcriptional regulator n=1 Tax=Salinispora cortesiana TaxID=1305843 RepID=UPI0003FA5F32|nr:MerR family transcriptional regulator [Salinispora cortesiana]
MPGPVPGGPAPGSTRRPSGAGPLMRIGEAAERVGLSIRTIRHYEDAGLIIPSARSEGGFRLYTDADLERLAVVKRMKPLGFSLDEMRALLAVLDALVTADAADRPALLDRLGLFHTIAATRVETLREQLRTAEGFASALRHQLDQHGAHH